MSIFTSDNSYTLIAAQASAQRCPADFNKSIVRWYFQGPPDNNLAHKKPLIADERELRKLAALAVKGAVAQQQVQEQEDKVRNDRATLRNAQADARTTAFEVRRLQLERQRIQQQLQDTVVTAPLDGVVLGVNVKDSDGVEFRTDLLTVGDPTQPWGCSEVWLRLTQRSKSVASAGLSLLSNWQSETHLRSQWG